MESASRVGFEEPSTEKAVKISHPDEKHNVLCEVCGKERRRSPGHSNSNCLDFDYCCCVAAAAPSLFSSPSSQSSSSSSSLLCSSPTALGLHSDLHSGLHLGLHEHPLLYELPPFSVGCDVCRKSVPFKSFRCKICDFDVCRRCYERNGSDHADSNSDSDSACMSMNGNQQSSSDSSALRQTDLHEHPLAWERPPYPAACNSCSNILFYKAFRCHLCSVDLCRHCVDPSSQADANDTVNVDAVGGADDAVDGGFDGKECKNNSCSKSNDLNRDAEVKIPSLGTPTPTFQSSKHRHALVHRAKSDLSSLFSVLECSVCESFIGYKAYVCVPCSFVLCHACLKDAEQTLTAVKKNLV